MRLIAIIACVLWMPAGQERTREEWIAWAKAGFEAPLGTRADVLIGMLPLLGDADPVLRDEVAYMAAERWMLREPRMPGEEIARVVPHWRRLLRGEPGPAGAPGVLSRSFAALCLSVAAARDVSAPFLDASDVHELVGEALSYFASEDDLRGFEPRTGWVHALAHTSDLLKFLARNPKLQPADHARILETIGARLTSIDVVFTWGEAERIGLALHALVRRPDFDTSQLDPWLARWVALHGELWAAGPLIEPARYARVENAKGVLRALVTALSLEATPSPQADAARSKTLATLAKMR